MSDLKAPGVGDEITSCTVDRLGEPERWSSRSCSQSSARADGMIVMRNDVRLECVGRGVARLSTLPPLNGGA